MFGFKRKKEKTKFEKMTTEELENFVDEGRTKLSSGLTHLLMAIMESEKRLHEIKYHQREGNTKTLKEGVVMAYKGIKERLISLSM